MFLYMIPSPFEKRDILSAVSDPKPLFRVARFSIEHSLMTYQDLFLMLLQAVMTQLCAKCQYEAGVVCPNEPS